MIDRQTLGLVPAKPHTALRDDAGNLLYEEMHTRGGFGGPFTYFYHRYPVGAHQEVSLTHRGLLALGEVTLRDWWRIMRREILAGLSLGVILGSIGLVRITVWSAVSQSCTLMRSTTCSAVSMLGD